MRFVKVFFWEGEALPILLTTLFNLYYPTKWSRTNNICEMRLVVRNWKCQ